MRTRPRASCESSARTSRSSSPVCCTIVQQTGDDDLVVRAELSQDASGLVRMSVVGPGGAEVAGCLLDSMEHQPPSSSRAMFDAGVKTTARRIPKPKKNSPMRRSGPYPSNVRHEYAWRGGS